MKKKVGIVVVIGIMLLGTSTLAGINAPFLENARGKHNEITALSISFSPPKIKENQEYTFIESDTAYLMNEDFPILPYRTEVLIFPFGTKIENVEVKTSEIHTIQLDGKIQPAPRPISYNMENDDTEVKEGNVYQSTELYPSNWISYNIGAGRDGDGHVIFLSVHAYPVRYLPLANELHHVDTLDIEVTYALPSEPLVTNDAYDLVIVAPSEFSDALQPLVNHKESYGVATKLVTLGEIYGGTYFTVNGRDDAEKVKYFIKDAIESWGIQYVLLVGNTDLLPVRKCCISLKPLISELPSDLYYADIYDKNYSFCSWDSDGDGKYGEYFHCNDPNNDKVDLYPDVFLGRLACASTREVNKVVQKIIRYETHTRGEEWFHNILLIGGDTHVSNDPGYEGCEGEYENMLVENIMCDFISTRIWASQRNLNPRTINRALNKGAGFVHYSGHGGVFAIGTHLPGNEDAWTGYLTPNLVTLFNRDKFPIVFFSACETGMLDANLADWGKRFGINLPEIPVSCFAWNWVKKTDGGAIATIGATRSSFTHPQALQGHGFLALKFFESYNTSDTLGQMFAQGQCDFRNNASWVPYEPPFDWCRLNRMVLEEFILLGDPSLKIGGYP